MEFNKVLVTGGTGQLGMALRQIKPDWIYLGRKDVDLTNEKETSDLFKSINPDAVIHLAAHVNGIVENANNGLNLYLTNTKIDMSVLKAFDEICDFRYPKRFFGALSTCMAPDVLECFYPLSEDDLMDESPYCLNEEYSLAKRNLVSLGHFYSKKNKQKACINFFVPCNLYGEFDRSNHFINDIVKKMKNLGDKKELTLYGTGEERRQLLLTSDAAKLIVILLNQFDKDEDIVILAPDENFKIKKYVDIIANKLKFKASISYGSEYIGQSRKDCSNNKLKNFFKSRGIKFEFTKFKDGIEFINRI